MAKKIIFMGTPMFAVPILKSLYQNGYPISDVYTQPPQKSQRGQKINKSPIQGIAETLNLDFRTPNYLKDNNDEYEYFKSINADLAIVVAYGKIIPENFLNLTNKGFINIHGSILPKWRGAAPIQRSIMNLDNETGISIMKIIPKLDAGPVMMKSKVKITKDTNYSSLSNQLSLLGAKMIIESLDLIEENKAVFKEQNENDATYAQKIDKNETKINWNKKAKEIIAKINGLYPQPGSWFLYKGIRLKINKAKEVLLKGHPGEILNEEFVIACSENAIQILEIQKEGKKNISILEYLKGNNIEIGLNVS